MRKVFNFCGLWSYPLGVVIAGLLDYLLQIFKTQTYELTGERIAALTLAGLLMPVLIMALNTWDYFVNGKRDFSPSLSAKQDVTGISSSKRKAMYPKISQELLSSKPEGLIVGKYGKKYVRIPIDRRNIMNSITLGSPGSGKSAGIFLTTLINNFMKDKPDLTVFALDIKPELARKSVKHGEDTNVKIVDFTDRGSYGWDVYYSLNENSTDDEKLRVFDGITRAMIVSSNPKDAFFVNNARTVMKGLLCYHYEKGSGFIDSITAITSDDVITQIKKALNDKEHCSENVSMLLRKYVDKESEAFQDIELTLQEHLSIFMNSDVRFHMRDNPRKAAPADLNRQTSVFVCLPLHLLDEFQDILRLISYQTCAFCESRGEDWETPVLMIMDELARLGKLENLTSLLSVGRSKGISVNMAFQDMSQLEHIYSKEEARTIFNLSEVTNVLSCKDNQTTREISDLIGEYKEEKISRNRSELLHTSDGKQHVSSEYRKIIETSDFQDLRKSQEAILIVEGKYYRVKQHRYYQDTILYKRYQEITEGVD